VPGPRDDRLCSSQLKLGCAMLPVAVFPRSGGRFAAAYCPILSCASPSPLRVSHINTVSSAACRGRRGDIPRLDGSFSVICHPINPPSPERMACPPGGRERSLLQGFHPDMENRVPFPQSPRKTRGEFPARAVRFALSRDTDHRTRGRRTATHTPRHKPNRPCRPGGSRKCDPFRWMFSPSMIGGCGKRGSDSGAPAG